MPSNLKEFYIAYFDILGYKNFFEEENNDVLGFLQDVKSVAVDTIREIDSSNYIFNLDDDFIVKSFSDNFIIMLENHPENNVEDYNVLYILSSVLARLQENFLRKSSILIRGGVTKGQAYIDDNIVFGPGLIRAVELENGAKFPRVIVDKNCFGCDVCNQLCTGYIGLDADDEYFIDYFKLIDPSDDEDVFHRHFFDRENIIHLVKKYGKYHSFVKDPKKIAENEKTISKYAWVLNKFNERCKLVGRDDIPYSLVFNHRLMKAEIQINK